jgi:hypothetical protein
MPLHFGLFCGSAAAISRAGNTPNASEGHYAVHQQGLGLLHQPRK